MVFFKKDMLQTTVYLFNIITPGAVSCLFRVAISVKTSSLKVLEGFLDKYFSKQLLNKQNIVSRDWNFHLKENSCYLTCQLCGC